MGKLLQMPYATQEHGIEDMLMKDGHDVICMDKAAYCLTLSAALARLNLGLPVRANIVKAFEDAPTARPARVAAVPTKKGVKRK